MRIMWLAWILESCWVCKVESSRYIVIEAYIGEREREGDNIHRDNGDWMHLYNWYTVVMWLYLLDMLITTDEAVVVVVVVVAVDAGGWWDDYQNTYIAMYL